MFWVLGLPNPMFWGIVMAFLAMIPVLGTFVIWLPAAAYLALSGDWGKAAILVAWGTVVIGGIDNFLYPILAGERLRLHTIPMFIAIVGGLAVFGADRLHVRPALRGAHSRAAADLARAGTGDRGPGRGTGAKRSQPALGRPGSEQVLTLVKFFIASITPSL